MRLTTFTLLIAFSLLSTGCKKVFLIYPTQTPNGTVSFRFEPKPGDMNEGVKITDFDIYRVISPDKPREMVWWIRTESGNPEKVYTITYGVVPPGFTEAKTAQPLVSGQSYEAKSGMPGISGFTEFKFGER